MLYLSLILIASGLFFIIYTLLIKAKKETETIYSKEASESISPKKVAEKISKSRLAGEQKNQSGRVIQKFASDTNISRDDVFEDDEKKVENKSSDLSDIEDKFEEERMSENSPVVMYEDSSNIIDYINNDSIIDSTLKEYKKIKRIGTGNLEISKDGINFSAGKKSFRFDFRRVANVKTGNNFIVLLMKGNDVLKLFLFKKNSLLSEKLKQVYNKYLTNVL
jgi:hypothetical protein